MFNWLKRDIQTYSTMPKSHKILLATIVILVALLQSAFATGDVRIVGPLSVKPVVGSTTTVSGTVAVSNFPASQVVTGPLTNTELRATSVPVTGPLTDAQLRATPPGVQIYGSTSTTATPVAVPLDGSTQASIVMDYEHHEIHSGDAYSFTSRIDVNGSGTIYNIMIVTSDTTKFAHMRLSWTTEAEFDIQLLEDATFTGGSAVTEKNRNRNSSNTATVAITTGATSTNGTELRLSRSGGGTGSGGGGATQDEWVLKRNTTYAFRFTKQSTGTHYISYKLWWYEHTDKN